MKILSFYNFFFYFFTSIYLLPLNEQVLCIYNLNLENDSKDLHKIYNARGLEGDKSI